MEDATAAMPPHPPRSNRSRPRGSRAVPSAKGVGGSGAGGGTAHPAPAPGGRISLALDLGVLAVAAAYLVVLWRQASPALFASDECFHAYLAEWIAGHAALPRTLPEFYSGLPYFYPPLFHLVGAALVKLAGIASLKYLNVLLTGLMVAALFALPVPDLSRAARRWAVLLCIASRALSLYAVRFYAETLATLLAVVVLLLLLRTRARPSTWNGVLLGLLVGAALLAKQPAGVLPVLLLALAAVDFAGRRRPQARAMLIALGVALVVAVPYFARNAMLFGSLSYPPITNNAQVALDAMNTRLFSLPAPMFYRNALIVMGPIVPWLAFVALGWNLVRGRFGLVTWLIAGSIVFTALAPWVPRFQPRHLNPVTAMLAVLGSITLLDGLRERRRLALALEAALLVWSVVFLTRLSGLRSGIDAAPADREAYRAIASYVPAQGTVLSRFTYDTWYYARRRATWPIPWGETAGQLELFTVEDPDRFLAALDHEGIGYLLVPRSPSGPRFNGANHPRSFVACVATLVESGRLTVLWGSDRMVLVARAK